MEVAFKIHQDIAERISYLHLCTSIMRPEKGGIANEQVKVFITSIYEFLNDSNERILIEKGPSILNLIDPLYQISLRDFPPRKELGVLAKEFQLFRQKNPEYYSTGLLYGWLNDLIDCTKLYREKIPSHSRVGVHMHAGNFAIEESIFLRDAFFFMILAEKELENLEKMRLSEKFENSNFSSKEYEMARIWNANVGTFCRTAHLNFYSFVEAFINGIGLDHLFVHTSTLSKDQQELLQGKKKNSFLSLEKKVEIFHEIIRPDKKKVIVTTDPNQIKEPFKTFFDECKEIRDSSVHFSALKEPIVRKPQEWIEKVHIYSKVALEAARAFWTACYETDKYPDYLDLLDYEILKKIALERINLERL